MEKKEQNKFERYENYTNRELSWLSFNERVLDEAHDPENPLLERLNFLGITQSNVDEFFMVRVASLHKLAAADIQSLDSSGMTPQQQIDAINIREHEAVDKRYSTFNRSLVPQLEKNNIVFRRPDELTENQREFISRYFNDELYPVLTPMADDSSRPFPFLQNNSLNMAIQISDQESKEKQFATLRVPDIFPRFLRLPDEENAFIMIEDIIREFLHPLFHGFDVLQAAVYRVIRDMDIDLAEQNAPNRLKAIQAQLREREHGSVMRLEVENSMSRELCDHLVEVLHVPENAIYRINGPVDLTFLKKLPRAIQGHDDLRYRSFHSFQRPGLTMDDDMFASIRKRDYLMQHPYDSFDSVVNFIHQAATDPEVLAIKMTLYRVSGNSPIVAALAKAADNGKQVTVLVELKARFDEQNNIVWARMLEKAGCHVIYGLVGLKTHSKITLVVRREEDGIRRYVHLATGNYNDVTAKLYTDCGLMTCKEPFGEDATAVFNMLSGYSEPKSWNRLILAPLWMKNRFLSLIDREAQHAKNGEPAHITAKMNSLCDPDIIEGLYKANAAGVEIDLIIRGICCLKVGIPGISDHIRVRSIVGNFLEHSRIFKFENAGRPEYYAGSADWMPRNLDRRVEIVFPLEDENVKKKAEHILQVELADTMQASLLKTDGTYEKVDRRGKEKINSQLIFCNEAVAAAKAARQQADSRHFIPEEHHQGLEEQE